ncbi:hypothetical protein BVX93_00065, partial [bacterium B13(2017)]
NRITELQIKQTEVDITSELFNTSPTNNQSQSAISGIRSSLMHGIKNSLLNLENAVLDPKNKVPEEWQIKFMSVIESIKSDFESGFGVDFETFETKSSNQNFLLNLI